MVDAARLRQLMNDRGLTQSELARRVGISQTSIAKLVTGSGYGSKFLHRIAQELGTSPGYLEGLTDDPKADAIPLPSVEDAAEQLDLVSVQQIDLAYGLGATFVDNHVNVDVIRFPRLWMEAITSSPPALLTWARGRGDSMEPTIHDGDVVLIDRSQRVVVEQDAVWAYTVGDLGAIKRLRIKGDRVVIHSDNQSVRPDEESIDQVNIVGRVIFVGKRL
ncbi:transcriptional regulator [Sphingomonas metalli]|uniref:Transcriptional regulator n=1 Tax=Sphingomonas metalli TaxID=1779358 RepID=A0A916WQM9_9SPHN|nr:S24 family peptidase [Sphingomonas metalli]GGB21347.1 transcriptional regulator [Sphingomonas metalli]